ncbi:glucosaminidase domain-containing protein [Staphylococcus epidermidis]|jgi:mannosyl-glycoprotein endo-beta-N-acetylglucosaminidase|uniref:glucosaminidase domain-containing protein n=3 Tax=Staphylococcus epidermidis TaxID=1282 RepID=UPI00138B1133|nr:glucosaminidase domain-containing protein [Staphylococcus epidermidis]EAF9399123.1 CHAP domain-containing protein [Listeria monocytogenes]MBM0792645.1 CHAP domain-containing protein [Staphylococcus epidermidis]MBM0831579.1 CHAP domain-containing protein [Staphylococcus epidermidis]MDH8783351.1 glucosaminidase domain-containing protein [Staphylococcus epidermidis]MDH8930391.1 glucosaminidase domain-containing protein [Staphylococcus epidermidis]
MAILPKSGKPTASQVVDWAKWMAKNHKGVDIDGRYGFQCWDLPNYIFQRYWHFRTWGNANAMANRSQYPNRSWKIYRNTSSFIPKPGDIAVWTYGWAGHTAIVVGPSDKSHFKCVDQNWVGSNQWSGSRAAFVNHNYNGNGGNIYFVRPPYKAEKNPPKPSGGSDTSSTTTTDNNKTVTIKKKQTHINFTIDDGEPIYPEFIRHDIVQGKDRGHNPKKVTIRNANTMCSVLDLYFDREKYLTDKEYPHYFVDRNHIWQPRLEMYEVPSHPDNIVIEVCQDLSASKDDFIVNEIHTMLQAVFRMKYQGIPVKPSSIEVDTSNIWRSVYEHGGWDISLNGLPPKKNIDKTINGLLYLYKNSKKLLSEIPKDKVKTKTIKVTVSASSVNKNKTTTTTKKGSKEPSVVISRSAYSFKRAVAIQMTKSPQINYGNGWYGASYSATLNAMNSLNIWNSKTQKYQMLNLGKYQGVSVSALNKILRGKGSLSGQGKAVAYACKKYNLNEIYLIAHAFLESGYGTSYFSSGRAGVYNYFGIGAYDWNPNNAIPYARNRGWTTPAKGIIGGAKFVRQGYISKGQNTLYRMRWNPRHPGNHQYATDVRWAQVQATTIKNLYDKIGIKGEHFIRDRYK